MSSRLLCKWLDRRGVQREQLIDCIQDVIRLLKHVFIENSHHPATVGLKPAGARLVTAESFIGKMGLTIEFNNQSCLWAEEISDVRANRCLPAKAVFR